MEQQSKVKIISENLAYSPLTLVLFLTHMLSAWLRQFDRFTGSRLRHSHVHPYDNRPFQSHLILMMNWTSIESQKGVTVVTAWPVNHLQSAFFLCSLLDASRLGPSPRGASKHSEEMKNGVEGLRLMFGNFVECDPLALTYLQLKGTETLTFCGAMWGYLTNFTARGCTQEAVVTWILEITSAARYISVQSIISSVGLWSANKQRGRWRRKRRRKNDEEKDEDKEENMKERKKRKKW